VLTSAQLSISLFELMSARTPLIFASYSSTISYYVFTFFFARVLNSLAGKTFLVRSIKLCLVGNQQSSGVAVAEFESCRFEAGSSMSRSSQLTLPTSTSLKMGQCLIKFSFLSER
jgi:hypothetical protein